MPIGLPLGKYSETTRSTPFSVEKTPSMTVYVPYWDPQTYATPSLVLRTAAGAPVIAPLLRSVIQELDSSVPIGQLQPLEAVVAESVAPRRFQMMLILLFAALGSVLACIGVYGVVSYWVAQRVPELGVRIALGAEPATIHRLVIRQGLLPVVLGLIAGLVLSMGADRVLGSLLFGISPRDPLTITAAAVALLVVAVTAIHLPARRAMQIEPVVALREE